MIRITSTTQTQALDDMIGFAENVQLEAQFAMDEAVQTIEGNLRDELAYVPPQRSYPSEYPIEWTSEKQRRYVMGFVLKRDEEGNIIPYQRTGRMANAWEFDVVTGADGIAFIIQNPIAYSRFVVGTLAQNINRATVPQQRFHRRTGWVAATETVQFWLDVLDEEYEYRVDERMGGVGTASERNRRSYTSRAKS